MLPEANPYRYEYMHLQKIRDIIARCPVAIQPCGLLEWHGEQNAIGLDGLKAYYMCERAITALGDGVLMPINWVGTYGFIRYPGTVCYNAHTTYSVFRQIYQELMKLGFKVIVILTGHYGQWQMEQLTKAHADAIQEAKERKLNVRLFGWRDPDLIRHIYGGDHAGEFETSMLWRTGQAWGIDLVDIQKFQGGEQKMDYYPLVTDKDIPLRERPVWTWNRDLHDPSICSPAIGEKLIAAESSALVLEILQGLEELGYNINPKIDQSLLEKQVFGNT